MKDEGGRMKSINLKPFGYLESGKSGGDGVVHPGFRSCHEGMA